MGLPTHHFDAEWKENEWEMRKDMVQQAIEMLEKAGYTDIRLGMTQALRDWESRNGHRP